MIFDRSEQHPGARFLLVMACGVVVVWGLQFAAPIVLPFVLALFLAVLSLPLMLWLQRKRVPAPLAIAVAVLLVMAVFGILALLASQSLGELQQDLLRRYMLRLDQLWHDLVTATATRLGFPGAAEDLLQQDFLDPQAVVDLAGGAVQRAAGFVSQVFLVFLIMVFILAEAAVFPGKMRAIVTDHAAVEDRLGKVVREVQEYLGIKTMISLATGLLLGAWCWLLDLDFFVLLGLIAFMLNYVPTVGSIIAAVPAMLLSLIAHGTLGHFLLVTVGYVSVNTLFGNILEPSLMGRRLGLSTLVVIMSLLFWGWIWGPVGALLSVPLTMVVKIWLENTHDLRWVALLLDKQPPQAATPERGPAGVDDDPGI